MWHILRLPDGSLVNQALLGWLTTLEDKVESKKKTLMITAYWRRLLKEAGIEVNMIQQLTSNCLNWKAKVKRRQLRMEEYERQQGKIYAIPEGTEKIDQRSQAVECDDANVCIKVVIEHLDHKLHLQSIKNGCTETLLMHLYLYP